MPDSVKDTNIMSDIMDIGIVCSHLLETRTVVSLLTNTRKERFSLFAGYTGNLYGLSCAILESGMGADRAYLAAKQIISLFKPCVILDFGVAAGVNPALSPGMVFLAEKARDLTSFVRLWEAQDPFFSSTQHLPGNMDIEEIPMSSEILAQVRNKSDVKTGMAGSADFFLRSSLVREELGRRGIDIFDYETFSVVKAASESGIPVLSIRGVSDLGNDSAQEGFRKNFQNALVQAGDFLPIFSGICFDCIRNSIR